MDGISFVRAACPACHCPDCRTILDFGNQAFSLAPMMRWNAPAINWRALLQVCEDCGLVFFREPVALDLADLPRNPHTRVFPREYSGVMLEQVLSRTDRKDRIWDFYCEDGELLRALRDAGAQDLMGVEPSSGSIALCREAGLPVRAGVFSHRLAEQMTGELGWPDLVLVRNALEHAFDLTDFFAGLKYLLDRGGRALIQLPDFDSYMQQGAFDLLIGSHYNFFTRKSLERTLRAYGLRMESCWQTEFGGGHYWAEVRGGAAEDRDEEEPELSGVERFVNRCHDNIETVRCEISSLVQRFSCLAACGVGVRGHTLLGYAGITGGIGYVVEDKLVWRGRTLPGIGLPVARTEQMHTQPPEVCLLMPQWDRGEQAHLLEKIREWFPLDTLCVEFCPADRPDLFLIERPAVYHSERF